MTDDRDNDLPNQVMDGSSCAQDASELSDPSKTPTPTPKRAHMRNGSERRRPYTLPGRVSRRALERMRSEAAQDEAAMGGPEPMPNTWGQCKERFGEKTPCPYVRCRHHNGIEIILPRTAIRPPGIKIAFPHLDVTTIPETCSLRAAEQGQGMRLDDVATNLNMTRERARQIEASALAKLKAHMIPHAPGEYDDHFDDNEELH